MDKVCVEVLLGSIPANVGQPAIKVKDMTVGGRG